jgi:hypothetical protein
MALVQPGPGFGRYTGRSGLSTLNEAAPLPLQGSVMPLVSPRLKLLSAALLAGACLSPAWAGPHAYVPNEGSGTSA